MVAQEDFEAALVELRGDVYRHFFRARRLAIGEELRLVDGKGRARRATVSEISGSSAIVQTAELLPSNEPPLRLEILVPAPRPPRLSWLVEKCTELGVAAIRLIDCERAGRTIGSGALERLRRVAKSAVEQSNRAIVPEISGIHQWKELRHMLSHCQGSLFMVPSGSDRGVDEAFESISLVIGPEGGWNAAERAELEGLCSGSFGLGPRILRIETAAVAAAALLLGQQDLS